MRAFPVNAKIASLCAHHRAYGSALPRGKNVKPLSRSTASAGCRPTEPMATFLGRRMGRSPQPIVASSSVPASWVSLRAARPMVDAHRAFEPRVRVDPPSIPRHDPGAVASIDVPSPLSGDPYYADVGNRRRTHKTAVKHYAERTYVNIAAVTGACVSSTNPDRWAGGHRCD